MFEQTIQYLTLPLIIIGVLLNAGVMAFVIVLSESFDDLKDCLRDVYLNARGVLFWLIWFFNLISFSSFIYLII